MKILISPNSFKGTFSSIEASDIIAEGILNYDSRIKIKKLPIADGGDGTLEVFKYYFDYISIKEQSINSMGKKIDSEYIIIDKGKTAVIEYANTCGLVNVDLNKLNLRISNSYGFGLQIKSAIEKGIKNIIITLGGSSTIDGGCGAMRALGTKFYDNNNCEINDINPIITVKKIDFTKSIINNNINFTILSDVDNYIFGDNGCVKIYGKQKGLNDSEIPDYESYLKNLSLIFNNDFNINFSKIKYGGAAGGAAGFLKVYLNANIYLGSEYIFNKINYKKNINKDSVVITGEGKLDSQTKNMKAPFSLISYLRNENIFSIAIGGVVDYKYLNNLLNYFDLIFSTTDLNQKKNSINNAKNNLLKTSYDIARIIKHKLFM